MKKYSHDIGNLKRNRFMNFQIGLIIALSSVYFSINYTSYFYETKELPSNFEEMEDIEIIPRTAEFKKKVPPPPAVELKDIIDPELEVEFDPEPEPEPEPIVDKPANTDVKVAPKLGTKAPVTPPKKIAAPTPPPKVEVVVPPPPKVVDDEVKTFVDRMPLFVKCDDLTSEKELRSCSDKEIIKFITKRIKYPVLAREQGVEGTVVIKFVVGKDGQISDINILKEPGYGLGEEAMRIVKKLPKWERGGSQRGRKVKVYFTLPIRFKLDR